MVFGNTHNLLQTMKSVMRDLPWYIGQHLRLLSESNAGDHGPSGPEQEQLRFLLLGLVAGFGKKNTSKGKG